MTLVRKRRRGVRKFFSKHVKGHRRYGPSKQWPGQKVACQERIAYCMSTVSVPLVDCRITHPQYFQVHKEVNVMSLFDGISTAYSVLTEHLSVHITRYFASEIDHSAIQVSKFNTRGDITYLGDVRSITPEALDSLPQIHLLLGGSPCDDLATVNPRRKGLYDPQGTGVLFFEFARILKHLHERSRKEKWERFHWLFENVRSMELENKAAISRTLGCEPIEACASSLVGMKRNRFYWGNIPQLHEVPARLSDLAKDRKPLQAYLDPGRVATVEVLPAVTTNKSAQRTGPSRQHPVLEGGKLVPLRINEIERLFGLPAHYTDCGLTSTERLRLLGKGWSCDVVAEILRPLTELWQGESNA